MLFRPSNSSGRRLLPSAAAGLVFLAQAGFPLPAQQGARPLVYPGGVVNAASFAPAGGLGGKIAPASIVSIFGENLAAGTASATSLPLPNSLLGTSVSIGGFPAPLFHVSPGQLNAQVPSALFDVFPFDALTAGVIVETPEGASDPVKTELGLSGAGIFTLDFSGCGRAAILNVSATGEVSLNSPSNSVEPGGILTIFATGLGNAHNLPPDGHPAASQPLSSLFSGGGAVIGASETPTEPLFSGKAPGFVGLDQTNVRLTEDAPEGCMVPLRTGGRGSRSQAVPVSIRSGGGQCVDPPEESFGLLHWRKTVAVDLEGEVRTETFTAEFAASVGKEAPPLNPIRPGVCLLGAAMPAAGPKCPGFSDRLLDAGSVTIQGAALGPLDLAPQPVDDGVTYSADLPEGTLGMGVYTVRAAGGEDIGAFESSVSLPPPIQLTTEFPPGSFIDKEQSLTVTWDGGQEGSLVTLDVRGSRLPFVRDRAVCVARAEDGQVTLGLMFGKIPVLGDEIEIIVRQFPDNDQVPLVEAGGLTLGGRHAWAYEFRFGDLVSLL